MDSPPFRSSEGTRIYAFKRLPSILMPRSRHFYVFIKEMDETRKMVEEEFPDDPALQQVHIARKIIAKEAELEGLSFFEYTSVSVFARSSGLLMVYG